MSSDTLDPAVSDTTPPEPPRPERGWRRVGPPPAVLAWPAWAWFVFFFLMPVGLILIYSLGYQENAFKQIPAVDFGNLRFENYQKAFDPDYFPTFRRTLQIAVTGTFFCLLIGVPFAYWLAVKVPAKWRGVLLGLVLVPFWTNFLVRTIGWQLILSPEGFFSDFLQNTGLRNAPLSVLYTRLGVQIGVVYNYLPLMILPLFVAFDRINPALREASKDMGAGRWRTFWQVSLPLAMPGVAAGMLLVFIPLMGDYITAALLGGTKGSMAGQLVASVFLSTFNWSLGAAMAGLLIAFILGSIIIFGLLGLVIRSIVRARRRVSLPEGVKA
jgi:spermidine/putrescine transport system permease protein